MGLVASIAQTTPSKEETGSILIVFTKVGFVSKSSRGLRAAPGVGFHATGIGSC
jgi:hypothetical protein